MKNEEKHIILVRPPIKEHETRGIGFYTERLFRALSQLKDKDQFSRWHFTLTGYGELPADVDIIHYPYFDPFFLTLPFFKKKKTIVTVHDLIPFVFPGKYPSGVKGAIKWQINKRILKNTDGIITDSNSSKKDIIKYAGIKAEKIAVIYLAPGSEFKKITDKKYLENIRQKYSLPEKFILYVGDVNYNKNIPGLISAFSTFHSLLSTFRLVLVGQVFSQQDFPEVREIDKLIAARKLEDKISKLGFMTTQDLAAIYNLASVYCQPSFYEGFGLPVLEAMKSGCPVVCSGAGSLKEITNEAALVIDPCDSQSIASGIKKIMTDEKARKDYIAKGLKQADLFSWEKTAEKTIAFYRKIIDGKY